MIDWKADEKNKGLDEKKYESYWRNMETEKKEVCRILCALSYLTRVFSIRLTTPVRGNLYVFVAFVDHYDVYLMSHLLQASRK